MENQGMTGNCVADETNTNPVTDTAEELLLVEAPTILSEHLIDQIVKQEGNGYWIKWSDGSYETMTFEENVPSEEVEIFRSRASETFCSVPFENRRRFPLFDSFELNSFELNPQNLTTLNIILDRYSHGDWKVTLADDWNLNLMLSFAAFFQCLYRAYNGGRYAIVCGEESSQKWYNVLKQLTPMTTIEYIGSSRNRELIREIIGMSFHIIIITTDVLESDAENLKQLEINACVLHNADVELPFAHDFVIAFRDDPQGSGAATVNAFASLLVNSKSGRSLIAHTLVDSIAMIKMRTAAKMSRLSGTISVPQRVIDEYYIDCPLSHTQRQLVKKVAINYDISTGFLAMCHQIYQICNHPFLMDINVEKHMDSRAASMKIEVFDVLLEKLLVDGDHVVVVSGLDRMLDIIEDIMIEKMIPYVRSGTELGGIVETDHPYVFLHNPMYCQVKTSILEHNGITKAIFIGGDVRNFVNVVKAASTVNNIYHLLCNECDERSLAEICTGGSQSESPNGEIICQNCVMNACVETVKRSPQELIERAAKSIPSAKVYISEVVDLWNEIKASPNDVYMDASEVPDNETWTRRERNELIRALFAYGLNCWGVICQNTGLRHSEKEITNVSRALIREMLNAASGSDVFPMIREFIRGDSTMSSDKEIDRKVIDNGVFSDTYFKQFLHRSAPEFLKRLELLKFLRDCVEEAGVDYRSIRLNRAIGSLPSEWWTELNDRMLVLATYKYGFGRYEYFYSDPEQQVRQLFSCAEHSKLNERVMRLAAVIKRSAASVVPEPSRTLSVNDEFTDVDIQSSSGFSSDEKKRIYSYLCRYGFTDYEELRVKTGISRSLDEVREYVDDYLARVASGRGLPPNTATRVKLRIAIMRALSEVLEKMTDSDWGFVPKWRQMPDEWTPALERRYFTEIRERGLGVYEEILALPEFSSLRLPPLVTRDKSVQKRIQTLHDYIQNPIAPAVKSKPRTLRPRAPKRVLDSTDSDPSAGESDDGYVEPPSKPRAAAKPRAPKISDEIHLNTDAPGQVTGELTNNRLLAPDAPYPTLEEVIASSEVTYPLTVSPTGQIISLGTIVTDRPGWHTYRYVYPAGFVSCRLWHNLEDPGKKSLWISEIIDTGGAPLFKVTAVGEHPVVFQGSTPTAPWASALRMVGEKDPGKGKSISGPDSFLLSNPIATYLVQKLPGIEHCSGYVVKDVGEKPKRGKKPPAKGKKDKKKKHVDDDSEFNE